MKLAETFCIIRKFRGAINFFLLFLIIIFIFIYYFYIIIDIVYLFLKYINYYLVSFKKLINN